MIAETHPQRRESTVDKPNVGAALVSAAGMLARTVSDNVWAYQFKDRNGVTVTLWLDAPAFSGNQQAAAEKVLAEVRAHFEAKD